MAKKYYAVKSGGKTGIFTNWNEVKSYVSGYPNAIFKSFNDLSLANEFLNNNPSPSSPKVSIMQKEVINIYVDGSYSDAINAFSYAFVATKNNAIIHEEYNHSIDPKLLSMRNVAGELLATTEAIKWAYSNQHSSICILYDYQGIEKWANKEWKTNKEGTKEYSVFIDKYSEFMDIHFIKVKAHSGVTFNERADNLATLAIQTFIDNPQTYITPKNEYQYVLDKIINEYPEHNIDKDNITYNINGYTLSNELLKLFIKKCWKYDGNFIKSIADYSIVIDSKRSLLEWKILDKNNEEHKFHLELTDGECN